MYHVKVTLATARRILRQLSHDRRTLGLIFLVPCVLLGLLRWLYTDTLPVFNMIAPALLGIFPFIIMFIITSITTLRERTTGTMERLMALPVGKGDIVMGYMLAFGLLASIQAALASVLLLYGLGLNVAGPHGILIIVAVCDALLGTALGVFVSAFARTEFQAVQFMPAFIFPQILIGGLLVPLAQMPSILESIAYWLPLTYAIDALGAIVKNVDITADSWRDIWIITAYIVAAIIAATATLRRRTR